MSDLRLRVISAVILGPLVLFLAYWGGLIFTILVAAAGLLFLREWFSMTGTRDFSVSGVLGYSGLVIAGACYWYALPAVSLAAVCVAACAIYFSGGLSQSARWGAEGVVYSGFALLALLAIRQGEDGPIFLFFLLFVVWTTDICAYFIGRTFGGPKLWRRVSPNKTWSGAIGGLVFAIFAGAVYALAIGRGHIVAWASFAAFLSIASQAGDLFESAIKRRFDVKDSSKLIPGHGGIMDRIDGLVAAAIAAVILGFLSGGPLLEPMAGLNLH